MNVPPYPPGVTIIAQIEAAHAPFISTEALAFVAQLHRLFNPQRLALLQAREDRQIKLDRGEKPDFLPDTQAIRQGDWQVAPIPADLQKRHVEITGPVDRKMVINALNSGADMFMADFEDSNAPSWSNNLNGQVNLYDAIRHQIDFTAANGKKYLLNTQVATLLVRPRGWHLEEWHMTVDGKPVSASLFDFGLYFFHNAKYLLSNGSGPYFYLPKLENHHEARLWNQVFVEAQTLLGISQGSIKATVLIETILAAFEMDEIIYELREHMAGLNAGRWDYMFSVIKKYGRQPGFMLPDRSQITMTVPFMRAYTNLLVQTCHKRGAHAIGGMAAFIPSRRDEAVNQVALTKVTEDKEREARDGFDGTWVAHPDLVPVARQAFEHQLGNKPHQKDQLRSDVRVSATDLQTFEVPNGQITEAGVRTNINVALQYLESWLSGTGAAAIYNLMEDAATAEISRAQLWQWIHGQARLADGRLVTAELYRALVPEEQHNILQLVGDTAYRQGRYALAEDILTELVLKPDFVPFLTLLAYPYLTENTTTT